MARTKTSKSPAKPAGNGKRTDALDERLIDLISGGALITDACRQCDIRRSSLARWRRDDPDFDAALWSAEGQAIWWQRAEIIEQMRIVMSKDSGHTGTQIMGLRELLKDTQYMAAKLVARLTDKVTIDGKVEHLTISWATDPTSGPVIDHQPTREYVDARPGAADVPKAIANGGGNV